MISKRFTLGLMAFVFLILLCIVAGNQQINVADNTYANDPIIRELTEAEQGAYEGLIPQLSSSSLYKTDTIDPDEMIRVMVLFDESPIVERAFQDGYINISSYLSSAKGSSALASAKQNLNDIMLEFDKLGLCYEIKYEFYNLVNGFSCLMRYSDISIASSINGIKSIDKAESIYETCEVDVESLKDIMYSTGINKNLSEYTGEGMVVIVFFYNGHQL
ncbi:MAG: hypothetical protein PHX51_05845 [Clostridia bacterium]|nr:hypothetical protein [Clostridia bacterium]